MNETKWNEMIWYDPSYKLIFTTFFFTNKGEIINSMRIK